MNKAFLFVLSIFLYQSSYSQKQGNTWYFGKNGGIDFNGALPVPKTGSQIVPHPRATGWYIHNKGTAAISDSSGNLLFYSEGETAWNRNNQPMPNGNSLMGCYSSTMAALIIPVPASGSLFYLFTTDCSENKLANGLRYSVIDMCLDNGRGDIIPGQKNIFLLDTVSEKLTAVNHANEKDIWVIAHKHYYDAFYAYLITENGIVDTVITHIGSAYGPATGAAMGQMKASPDGKKLAAAGQSGTNVNVTELFDFDASTGTLSNLISLGIANTNRYALDFSPDNSKLYTGGFDGIMQYDLNAGTQAAIVASKTFIHNMVCSPCGMQLGPDGVIYFAGGHTIPAIIHPDSAGVACTYNPNYLDLGSTMTASGDFPSFISSFQYHNNAVDCSPLATKESSSNNFISLSPNPAGKELRIKNGELRIKELHIYSVLGVQLQSFKPEIGNPKTETVLNTSTLIPGIYFMQILADKQQWMLRFVKE